MNINYTKTDVLRRSNSDDIKAVWECIRNIRIQKQIAILEKIIKNLSRELNINEEVAKRMILNVEHDGLIDRCTSSGVNSTFVNGPVLNEFYNLPDFSKQCQKSPHDWNCFTCHLAGEIISCSECFRSYHIICYQELNLCQYPVRSYNRFPKSADKLLCPSCEAKGESEEIFSRKQVRKLLDFATHFIRKKSIWKDMSTIGFRGEIAKNEYLVYRYLDLELILRKIKDGRYTVLHDLIDDAELFVHNVCILHGIFSDKADQARVLLREIKDEIYEVKLCSDCYINAKAKLAEWITKPCKPPHKLLWAKQSSNPSGQYWPAKILAEKGDGFEIRFFGGIHDRGFVKKSDTKSFHFRPDEIDIKPSSGFDRAWNEVKKLSERVEQGYYTQSSGESDLPPTEDEYSDEIYLRERRSTGMSLGGHNLTNGSTYSLFGSLSSRRSMALEKTRKSASSQPTSEQLSPRKSSRSSVTSKSSKRRSSRKITATKSKRLMSTKNAEKSNPSYVKSEKTTSERSAKKTTKLRDSDSESSLESDDSENSSLSVNMKSINFKFSPKTTNTRSPMAAAKGLRQNRKPTSKMSQLSTGRYTSLSDRIKMDLSSTESSEFNPNEECASVSKKRLKKNKYTVVSPIAKSPSFVKPKRSQNHRNLNVISPVKMEVAVPSLHQLVKETDTISSSNEETEKCCSPDQMAKSRLFGCGVVPSNHRLGRPPGYAGSKRGIAAADSTSNNIGLGPPVIIPVIVTTTSPGPNRQRINSGYNPMSSNHAKRMVHKCVYTTMPVCNCEELFAKKLVDEREKLSKEHGQLMIELEIRLRANFEEEKSLEIKKVTDDINTEMKELLDNEKVISQDALVALEARHSETLTNTKRRQWCRNCLKEAIYHCCWNTSYCSIQCQQEHWQKEHKRVCRRKR